MVDLAPLSSTMNYTQEQRDRYDFLQRTIQEYSAALQYQTGRKASNTINLMNTYTNELNAIVAGGTPYAANLPPSESPYNPNNQPAPTPTPTPAPAPAPVVLAPTPTFTVTQVASSQPSPSSTVSGPVVAEQPRSSIQAKYDQLAALLAEE